MNPLRTLIAAFLIAQVCAVATEPRKSPPLGKLIAERGVVLPADVAPGLFRQCSRPAPVFLGNLWTPTPADLAQFESRFPVYYESKTAFRSMTLDYYYRQNAGFIAADGRRLIYTNFFPWAVPSAELQKEDPIRWDPDLWKKAPQIICDGGGRFFGVVFEPATGRFSDLELNGF